MTDAPNSPPARNRVTIRDVAVAAGVSIGTVSKSLNPRGRISAATRAHVQEVAARLGFRPNDLAQALHRGASLTVGLISNDDFGRFTMPIMAGLEEVLHGAGMAVFMCNATDDPARERRHLDQLLAKQVDGIVFTARRADQRAGAGVDLGGLPSVHVFARGPAEDDFCILPDDAGGATLVTDRLIALGRRRIAHVTGPLDYEAVKLRLDGFRSSLARAGLAALPGHVLHGDWSEDWGRCAAAQLFGDPATAPDAVFAGNDQIGRGLLDGLRDAGIAVPGRVAVIGFDNWSTLVEAARPRLSSIDMNLRALGQEAGRRLIRMIAGERFSGALRIPATLVVRDSCGPLPPT